MVNSDSVVLVSVVLNGLCLIGWDGNSVDRHFRVVAVIDIDLVIGSRGRQEEVFLTSVYNVEVLVVFALPRNPSVSVGRVYYRVRVNCGFRGKGGRFALIGILR